MSLLRKFLDGILRVSPGIPTENSDASEENHVVEKKYHQLPGSRQWSPSSPVAVNKDGWKPCGCCGRNIPVVPDVSVGADGQPKLTGTWSAVCPFCDRCQVGTPAIHPSDQRQQTCHECGVQLGEKNQCPDCSFPRGWMRVNCPYCGKRHPVLAPHWVDYCDTFRLECVHCESVFISLCIC